MNKKRKIALLLAGGTHLLDKNGQMVTVDKEADIDFWLSQMPELNIMAEIEPVFVSGEYDNNDAHSWEEINTRISSLDKNVDAFIVVTKLGSLIDTSLALSFSLQHIDKTIICTSSQIDLHDFSIKKNALAKLKAKNSFGLKSNLINALQASERLLPAPAIMFGTRLMPASKAIWDTKDNLDLLASTDNVYWGKVDFGINIKDNLGTIKKTELVRSKIYAKLLAIEDVPGVDWYFGDSNLKEYQGLIIKVSNGQGISDEKKKQILDWDIPTVLYNADLDLPSDKIASLTNCTWNAALIKTMWVLANQPDVSSFKKDIASDFIGEFNI